jgi:NAD(P)H-dependent FMN reductase
MPCSSPPPLHVQHPRNGGTTGAAAFVSYGVNGGTRTVEHLRAILAEVKVAGVRTQVAPTSSTMSRPIRPGKP